MAITKTVNSETRSAMSGLDSVTQTLSFSGGGGIALGTLHGKLALQLFDAKGFPLRMIDLGAAAEPLGLVDLKNGSYGILLDDLRFFTVSKEGAVTSLPGEFGYTGVAALPDGMLAATYSSSSVVSFFSLFNNIPAFDSSVNLSAGVIGNLKMQVLNNGNLALAWTTSINSDTQVWTAVLRTDGTVVTAPAAVDTSTVNTPPVMVATSTGYAIAYLDVSGGQTDVKLAYLNQSGTVIGTQQLTASTEVESGLAMTVNDGKIWVSYNFPFNASDTDILATVVSESYVAGETPLSVSVEISSDKTVGSALINLAGGSVLSLANNDTTGKVTASIASIIDVITGDAAADTYTATARKESISLGGETDTVSYAGSTAAILIKSNGQGFGGFAEGDTILFPTENIIGSAYNDRISMNSNTNYIRGGAGNDTLLGMGGNDTLEGGAGRDVMRGGVDADSFVFKAKTETGIGTARDVIADFVSAQDKIDLSGIDAKTTQAGNQAFLWGGTTAKAFGVWLTTSGSDVIVKGDINGDKVADFEIMLKGAGAVVSTDFIL